MMGQRALEDEEVTSESEEEEESDGSRAGAWPKGKAKAKGKAKRKAAVKKRAAKVSAEGGRVEELPEEKEEIAGLGKEVVDVESPATWVEVEERIGVDGRLWEAFKADRVKIRSGEGAPTARDPARHRPPQAPVRG